MTANRRIFLNIVATYGRSLYALVIGLFCGRWTLMALGQTDYGLYGLVGGLTVFITFLNGILSVAIARYFAVSVGMDQKNGNHEESNKWFTLAVAGESILPVIFIGIGYPLGVWAIEDFLTIPLDRVSECIWVWRFVCASCFVGMVTLPFSAMYSAKQYIAELTVYSFITTTLNACYLYYMITHPGVWLAKLAFWACLLSVLPQIIIACRGYFLFPECRFKLKYLKDISGMRQLVSYSTWTLIGWSGTMVRGQGIAILINKYFGPAVNAASAIGSTLSGQTNVLSGSLMGAFSPAIMNAYGAGNLELAKNLAYKVCKIGTLLMLIFSIPLSIEAQTVLNIWLKNPPDYSAGLCVLIMIMETIDKTTVGQMIMVNAKGKIALYQAVLGTALLLTVPLAWIFVACGFNVYWTGIAMIITMAFTAWGRAWFARRLVQMSARYWLKKILVPILIVSLLSLFVGYMSVVLFEPSLIRVAITTILCEVVLFPMSWIFLLDDSEKFFLLSRINDILSKIRK